MVPVAVSWLVRSVSAAIPKSASLASKGRLVSAGGPSKMFAGLMSRCTMPRTWTTCSASARPVARMFASSAVSGCLAQTIGERRAVDELHHQEGLLDAVDHGRTGVVERHESAVAERGEHEDLGLRPLHGRRVGLERRQDLDGHRALERGVDTAVHGRHTAPTERVGESVAAGDQSAVGGSGKVHDPASLPMGPGARSSRLLLRCLSRASCARSCALSRAVR